MKNHWRIIFTCLLFLAVGCNSPTNSTSSHSLTISTASAQPAGYPGGEEAMISFIRENLRWPSKEFGGSGYVALDAMVDADGEIVVTEIKRKLCPSCEDEAIRIVKKMPKWIPAINQSGEPIESKVTIPIRFDLYF